MEKNRRRHYLIEGNFQTRFVLRFVVVIVGSTLLAAGALLLVFFFKYKYWGADLNHLIIMVTPEGTAEVYSLFKIVLLPILSANILIFCIVVPYALFYSHRIAGPIYRFEQSLEMLVSGETNFLIVLRKKDEFKYLSDKMNALVDYMRRNIGEIKTSYRMLNKRVTKISQLVEKQPLDMKALNRELTELERFFKERKSPFSY